MRQEQSEGLRLKILLNIRLEWNRFIVTQISVSDQVAVIIKWYDMNLGGSFTHFTKEGATIFDKFCGSLYLF